MPNSWAIYEKVSMENKTQAYDFSEKDLLHIMKLAIDYIWKDKRFWSQIFVGSNIEFGTGEL